jgi:2-dehydropantoate 2-reductase
MLHIGVFGAGALGHYYGAMLQRAGHKVSFPLRRDFHSIHDEFHLPRATDQGLALPRTEKLYSLLDLVEEEQTS